MQHEHNMYSKENSLFVLLKGLIFVKIAKIWTNLKQSVKFQIYWILSISELLEEAYEYVHYMQH